MEISSLILSSIVVSVGIQESDKFLSGEYPWYHCCWLDYDVFTKGWRGGRDERKKNTLEEEIGNCRDKRGIMEGRGG